MDKRERVITSCSGVGALKTGSGSHSPGYTSPAMFRGTKFIDGQARHDGGQPSFHILDGCLVRLLVTQEGFLDNVFRFVQASEIAIDERQ